MRETTEREQADEVNAIQTAVRIMPNSYLVDECARAILEALRAEREACASLAEKELLVARCSPAGLDHNGIALGHEIIRRIRSRSSSPAPAAVRVTPFGPCHTMAQGGYLCSLSAGHDGHHEAHMIDGRKAATWPQDAPPSTQPTSPTPNPPEGQESGVDASK